MMRSQLSRKSLESQNKLNSMERLTSMEMERPGSVRKFQVGTEANQSINFTINNVGADSIGKEELKLVPSISAQQQALKCASGYY